MRRSGAVAVLALSAAYFAVGVLWRQADTPDRIVAYDFYGQFYPWQVHARRALSTGGWWWNPYQDCGQVFFANIQTALLYPVNLVFLLLPREPALLACVLLNLIIAGVAMYQLCRTLDISGAAALTAALAFQLGWAATQIASWSPTHIGTFVWIPVALWRVERLVRAPTLRNGIVLAVALAVQILAGFPQMVVLSYQVIALRIAWALLLRQASPLPLLRTASLALLVPPFLAAVQLLPALEVVRDSLWGAPLSAKELGKPIALLVGVAYHLSIAANPLLIVMACVAAFIAPRSPQRAAILFYLLLAGVYFLLHLGPGTFLFDLYARLPPAGAFRGPARLLWITNIGVAVLVGFAADAMLRLEGAASAAPGGAEAPLSKSGPERSRLLLPLVIIASAIAVQSLSARGFSIADSGLALLLAVVVSWGALRPLLPIALPAVVVLNTLLAGQPPVFTLRSGDVYRQHASLFDALRHRITAQDRMLIVGVHPDLDLMPKSGTVFALPNIQDYDPMVLRAYAELFTFMRTGRPYRDMEDWYWLFGKLLGNDLQRPLLDLTAARYLLVDQRLPRIPPVLAEDLTLLEDDGSVRLYENGGALQRARYVARLEVMPADEVLPRLAGGSIDPRTTAAADRAPQSGFTGAATPATGSVTFIADAPERVALRVEATGPGFLFLADAWAPGWVAQVNGVRQEIVRANHTFRLVEVPAGESEVVFTYRPASVWIGALMTMATALVMAWLWRRGPPSVRT